MDLQMGQAQGCEVCRLLDEHFTLLVGSDAIDDTIYDAADQGSPIAIVWLHDSDQRKQLGNLALKRRVGRLLEYTPNRDAVVQLFAVKPSTVDMPGRWDCHGCQGQYRRLDRQPMQVMREDGTGQHGSRQVRISLALTLEDLQD